nr:hypothetical protein [Psychromicrobium silvestre]
MLAFCLAIATLIPFASSASAAGAYTLSLTAPVSAPLNQGFSYTATISTPGASPAAPMTGVVLTSTLAPGLELDTLATGPGTPVQSYTYDPTTRVITFTLNDLTKQLTTFTYSVTQIDNTVKSQDTVLHTTISDQSGDPTSAADTKVVGDLNYHPGKSAFTVQGSNNRDVTYYLDVSTVNANAGTSTFTTWQQTLTDTLPAGAVITATSSNDGGTWTTTNNPDGTTTVTWDHLGAYGPRGPSLTELSGKKIWVQVHYPVAQFPDATIKPPLNTVQLTVKDHDGNAAGPTSASAQSVDFTTGVTKDIFLTKAAINGDKDIVSASGGFLSAYQVEAAYINGVDSDKASSMTVQDAATDSAGNAQFFDHSDVYYLNTIFNAALQNANLPYTLEYTTSANNSLWQTYTGSALTTGENTNFVVQTTGSAGMHAYQNNPVDLNIPIGEHLTGWRIVVSSGAALIPSGAEADVQANYAASYPSLTDGSLPTPATGSVGPIVNTATGSLTDASGVTHSKTDAANFTVQDRANIATFVAAPTSILVGSTAVYQATISNLDPVGRSYKNSELDVVLPPGVVYDPAVGITPAYASTPTTNIPVPTLGNGATVTTSNVTDANGEVHQVVHIVVADLPSLRTVGEVKNRDEFLGFRYNIPTQVLAQAFDPTQNTAEVTSWAFTNDPLYSSLRMDFYGPYYNPDLYDLDPALSRVAKWTDQSVVNTSGGLLLGKQVRADASADWGLSATVKSPGTVQWQVYVANALPESVTNAVVFDRLPYLGDNRGTQFPVTLSGPVTGAPAGAVLEYSTDATSASTGTWTTDPSNATAFRLKLDSLASGDNLTLLVSTNVPAAQKYQDIAVNDVTATADYQGQNRNFISNTATAQVEGTPSFTLVKKTNGLHYDSAPGAAVATGSTVSWTYQVTNTGDTPLDNVAISDAYTDGTGKAGTLTPTSSQTGTLLPGESRTFTATGTAVNGEYHNTATATATAVDAEGKALAPQPKAQTDQSWYLAGNAALTVEKTTNGQNVDSAPGLQLTPGDQVTWAYKVTNTGSLPLTNIDVTDKDSAGNTVFVGTVASLAAGKSVTLSASGKAISGQYHNTVTASAANPAGGDALQAADESWYFGAEPGISLLKQVSASPDGPWSNSVSIKTGASIYWQFTVVNTGNIPLGNVVIGDENLPSIPAIASLQPGETKTVVVKQDSIVSGYTNTASVSIPGVEVKTPGGTVIVKKPGAKATVTSSATVTIESPALAYTGAAFGWLLIGAVGLFGLGLTMRILSRRTRQRG